MKRLGFEHILKALSTAAIIVAVILVSGNAGSVYAAEVGDANINGFLTTPSVYNLPDTDVFANNIDQSILDAISSLNAVENQKDSDAGVPEEETPKKKDKETLPDYDIKVNLKTNTVTIYKKNEKGKFVPYRAMVCSIGRRGHETPEGKFKTSDYYAWRQMVDNTYGRYAVRFNHGIMFHSVPYYKTVKNSLEWQEYNKLGSPASLGCIRLAVADAKWIYDNCKRGTTVTVYTGDASTDPLGTPKPIKIASNSKHRDWDPTDLTPENPWLIPIE